MTSRIEKTIARQQEKYGWDFELLLFWPLPSKARFLCGIANLSCHYRIASGAYYEAHQQLRVIAARYIKQSNYDAAANILSGGAKALLQAGAQQGVSASGGDLAIMLVLEVYNKAGWEVADDETGKERKRMVSWFLLLLLIR